MGSIGKSLQGVLKVAAPFIPGVGGVVAGMIGGSGSQDQANGYYQQAGNSASLLSGLQSQYLPGIMQQLNAGAQDPYGQSDAIASRYQDSAAQRYQGAANLTNMSMAGRGFTGQNSITPALQASLARNTAMDVASNNRQTGIDASNQHFQRLMGIAGMLNGSQTGNLLNAAAPYQGMANQSGAAAAAGAAAGGGGGLDLFHQIFGHNGVFGQGGYKLTPTGNTNSNGAPITIPNGNTRPTMQA